MTKLSTANLSDARIQLHWAAQLLSAAADATLEKAADDSHSNVGWESSTSTMVGRAGCNLDVKQFELEYQGERLALSGKTPGDAIQWLAEKIGTNISLRDYDMPPHGVANGEVWSPDIQRLEQIADWFSFADKAMAGYGRPRIWPHHLDLGFLLPGDLEGTSIGGGFSPGDDNFDRPYFYINPYGIEKPDSLPDVLPGHWTDKWFGTVLTCDTLASVEDAEKIAAEFVRTSIENCKQLISNTI